MMWKPNLPLTKSAEQALQAAERKAKALHHSYIGTEHLLLGILAVPCLPAQILQNHQVTEEKILELMDKLIVPSGAVVLEDAPKYTPRLREVLEDSVRQARRGKKEGIGTEHLLLALFRSEDSVAVRLMHTMNVSPVQVLSEMCAAMGTDGSIYREELEEARKGRSGTPFLEKYSRDLTALARAGRLDPVIGRDRELRRLIQILSRRTKNNPCLIGEPGVGKTAIVERLALEIAAGQVPEAVREKRVMALDLSGMVAGSKYRGEFEERIKNVVAEAARDGSVLLFLDEIHTLIGAGGAEGALDAANILKPSLSRGEIQLIGATTVDEYRKHIEKDAALERRFQPILVEEPTEEETIEILHGLRGCYESHHGVKIEDGALAAATRLSARYVNDRFLPDKALDLLDEASAKARLDGGRVSKSVLDQEEEIRRLRREKELAVRRGDFEQAAVLREQHQAAQEQLVRMRGDGRRQRAVIFVTEECIADVVSDWTRIPVQKLAEEESVRLRRLEDTLHRRVIGQDEAVSAVSRAVRRSRVGLKDPARPIGSFLFLGPTGVGKTELSKALAEALFGKEDALIRVDMSEYMEKHSVSKLIGSPPGYVGYEEGGQLSEKVRRNPYSVILFDEIEKAHPDVFHILLQVLDDGHITDAQGRKVSFKNTILIMTSNAGAERIISPKKLGFAAESDEKADYERMKSGVMEEVRRIFRPEFLNRIDEILVFHSLSREDMARILKLMLSVTEQRIRDSLGITLHVTPTAREYLMAKGYDEKYGARPMRRALQTELEDPLAEEILSGRVKPGDRVTVSSVKNKLKFSVKD